MEAIVFENEQEEDRGFNEEQEEDTGYDEEQEERNEYRVDQLLREFRDEPPIQHDSVPDSDSEEDEEERERVRTNMRRGDGSLYKKQTFINGVAFKETVVDYALRHGRNLWQYRYDKLKLGFKCAGGNQEEGKGCEWQVYASLLPKNSMWKVSKFIDKHTCVPNGECILLREPVISRLFVDKIREDPEYYMPMKIEEIILEKWGITVPRYKCQNARLKALEWIEKEYDDQFARLKDYAAEILVANPDSTVEVDTLKNDEGQDMFNRIYICLDVLRKTWKNTCRKLIGVDGTFMKHKIKGQILVALGRDSDNAIYPIAWAAVQVENKDNWLWFVEKLKLDLGLGDGDGYIMVSDRQKGLIAAVELKLPKIEHRMCVKHIYENLKKNHAGKKQMKPLIWSLAFSYNEAEYRRNLDKIFCYDVEVYNDVVKANPKSWCRAYYKLGNCCEDVENNSTESFNATISKARELPFVPMLTMISRLAMARIARRSAIAHSHNGICTPYVTHFLAKEYKKAMACKVTRSTNGVFEAKLSGCGYRVNLESRTCTCMKWDITGIPCEHAYGVILTKKLVVEHYVCEWFQTAKWRSNYSDGLAPTRGAPFWPQTEEPDVYVPPQPAQPGRKKITKADKKRKRGVHESPTKTQPKQKKRIMHCSVCKSDTHNCRFHKKNPQASLGIGDQASQGIGESSPGIVTQGIV